MCRDPAISAVCLLFVIGFTGPVIAQTEAPQPPMEVTSDTPEYCLKLADRVHAMVRFAAVQPPREVSSLSAEGQRMCALGQTRGGLMRLRRALLIMMQDEAPRRN